VDPKIIGLQGSAYFIGFMISSLVVPRISDKFYGRRNVYLPSMIFCTILYVMIYLSSSIYINIFYFLCIGLCAAGRVCVGLAYMNEFVPRKYHNLTTTILNLGDSFIMLYQALFYVYAPDWSYIHAGAFLMTFGVLVLTF
jgi:MFS family permease